NEIDSLVDERKGPRRSHRREHLAFFTTTHRHLPKTSCPFNFRVIDGLAVERLKGRITPISGHLNRFSASGRYFPHFLSTGRSRCQVDPPAISRPATTLFVRKIRGQADWFSSTRANDIDIRVSSRIKIESNMLSIGRPARVRATRVRLRKQFHGVGAL